MLRSLVGSEMCIRDRYIVDAFVRAIPAHNKNVIVLLRRADPIEFCPVELNLLSTDNLVHIYGWSLGAKSQPVRFGDVVNVISRNHPARPWHVSVSYTHLRAHETPEHLVCRLLLEKK